MKFNFTHRVQELMKYQFLCNQSSKLGAMEQCQQLMKVIETIRCDSVIDNSSAEQLIQLIKAQCDQKQLELLDRLIVPQLQLHNQQYKEIEEMLLKDVQPIGVSIYGKMNAFLHYQNQQLINKLKSGINIEKADAEQLSSIAIGLGLLQSRENGLWKQIITRSNLIDKSFYQHMRIATGIGLSNSGNEEFWNNFVNDFYQNILNMDEDVFTQSVQVISQQQVIQLNDEQIEKIEQYVEQHEEMRNTNLVSLVASMARMQKGSQQFYNRLDIYRVDLYDDDLVQFVVDLLKVKHLLSSQTINSLVARAYSESENPELLDLISLLIKQQ